MKPISFKLLTALINHHKTISCESIPKHRLRSCGITYSDLCIKAGCPGMARSVGQFLKEISIWCAEKGLPPINSLAVNADTMVPSQNYDLAENCSLEEWEKTVTECITCNKYIKYIK